MYSLKKLARIKRRNSLLDVWVITADVEQDELVLQKSEVAEAKWVSRETLEDMIKSAWDWVLKNPWNKEK